MLHKLALCYYAAGQKEAALTFLRKSFNKHENLNDIMALLLAAKICSKECHLASEGVEYARRAVTNAESSDAHLKSMSLYFLGSCLDKKSKIVSSDHQRSLLQTNYEVTVSIALDCQNPDLIFDMGVAYAEQRNMNASLRCAKEYIEATGGSVSKGWRLLALVLSAQQRYSEAEVATRAALDETANWDQGSLLRIKPKLKVANHHPWKQWKHTVSFLLVQPQKNSTGSCKNDIEVTCMRHIGRPRCAGHLCQRILDKVAIGALLSKHGPKYLPAARCFLSDKDGNRVGTFRYDYHPSKLKT